MTYPKRVLPFILSVVCLCTFPSTAQDSTDGYTDARNSMVQKLALPLFGRTPVRDERVLEAMRGVPRHLFVPEKYRAQAYDDHPLPIGENQTISQPYIVARMTEALGLDEDDVVLEVGTGSGYQAAVLAELVKEVYTIEIVPELARQSKKVLKPYVNVQTRLGDGYRGWKEHAPFDAIIVTAAPDKVPPPLLEQLKPGGRMVIPVGAEGRVQELQLLTKDAEGRVRKTLLDLVRFVPLTREK